MNSFKLKYYIFLDELNEKIIENIKNLKKETELKLIISEKNFSSILAFAKRNKISYFITDNTKLAIKHKAYGIFITSSNKNLSSIPRSARKIEIIGSAHNQQEYSIKEKQQCSIIFLSPIFYNKKYTLNKILHINKFNLITLYWKKKIGALGGINIKNLKLLSLTKAKCVGVKSLITN